MTLLGAERVYDGRVIDLDVDTVRFPDGSTGRLEMIRHPGASAVVPFLDSPTAPDPRVLLLRQFRHAADGYLWEIPAGRLDAGEDPEACARRELREETGYELVEVQKVSPPNYSSTGMTDELVVMVYCTCRTPPNHRQHLDGAELIEVHPLTLVQVDQLVDTKEPINGRAWGAFYLYHRLRRFV